MKLVSRALNAKRELKARFFCMFCLLFLHFALHVKRKVAFKTSPQVRYYRDTYAEHPEDRKNIEYSVHLDNDEDLVTLSGIYEQMKNLDESFKLDYARFVFKQN